MKTTSITLKSLMAKKEAILSAKKDRKTAKVYVKSLDGTVTVSAPELAVVMEAQEMGAGRGDAYIVYQCVTEPNLKDRELQEAFGCAEPLDIVEKVFDDGEIGRVALECMKLAGYAEDSVKLVEDVKN